LEAFQTIYTTAVATVMGVSTIPLVVSGIVTLTLRDIPLSDGYGPPIEDEVANERAAAAAAPVVAVPNVEGGALPDLIQQDGLLPDPSAPPAAVSPSSVSVIPSEAKGYVAPSSNVPLTDGGHSD
jgi:hypothetical protein